MQTSGDLVKIDPRQGDALYQRCLATMSLSNVVATANLDVEGINVRELARHDPGATYNRHMFAALIRRLATPKSTSLIYVKGVMVVMGTRSVAQALLACHKYVRLLRLGGVNCKLVGFRPYNFVFSITTFPLDLKKLHHKYNYMVQYTTRFPGATVRCAHLHLEPPTEITIEAFESGKLNLTGARSWKEALRVFWHFYHAVLIHVRVLRTAAKRVEIEPRIDVTADAPGLFQVVTGAQHRATVARRKGLTGPVAPSGRAVSKPRRIKSAAAASRAAAVSASKATGDEVADRGSDSEPDGDGEIGGAGRHDDDDMNIASLADIMAEMEQHVEF